MLWSAPRASTVIDDHSRVAYAEVHDDETATTAIGVPRRAVAWFAAHDVRTERVLSDNGSAYKSHVWRDACAEPGITHKRTQRYRPQTNGTTERLRRPLAAGWAFQRLTLASQPAERHCRPGFYEYNLHRPHTAIRKVPPITRVTNLPTQYS